MNEKEIFEQNEMKANKGMAIACLCISVVLPILFILVLAGVNIFAFSPHTKTLIKIVFPILAALFALPIFFTKSNFFRNKIAKYFLLGLIVVAVAIVNLILPKDGVLLWAIPIVISMLYFDPRITIGTFILTILLMVIVTPLSMFIGQWDSNLMGISEAAFKNLHSLEDGHSLSVDSIEDRWYWINNFKEVCKAENINSELANRWVSCFVFYFLPRALIVSVLALLALSLSNRAEHILFEQINETKHVQKMTSELSIAYEVQAGILPTEFPDSKYGEIYAIMDPAKEVGGDLYDFFEIDKDHLALVIGDASGKGVPASLYMVKAQSVIRALCKSSKHLDTGAIMTRVNDSICEGNEMTMFVTCWLGIFDKEKGVLSYTNAGHNPPIIKLGQKFEYLAGKPGLVLGAFPNFEYKQAEITVGKGDKLFLYTDGVTEAHNVRSELYGEDRLLNLVSKLDASPYDTITRVREDVREFSRNTEQFDDITMLMLEYRKPQTTFSKSFEAKNENLEKVQEFIIDSIRYNLSPRDKNELMIVTEEIFVNIASYAYAEGGRATVEVNLDNAVLTLVFKDNGVEFNPLAKDDPNVKATAQDRQIGGLGIFMVKNLMDKVYYEYKDNKNILTLVKKYK